MNFYEVNPSLEDSLKPKQHGFSPYENNEGSIIAISGNDFVVIASDTRLSSGYSIHTRDQTKLFNLTDKCVLGCSGCWCDVLTFSRVTETRIKMYEHEHNKVISTPAISQLMTSLLYYKRFFPYYVCTVVAGLDEDGKGRVYSYDAIGHKNEDDFIAVGSSQPLLQPLLDNQVSLKNMQNVPKSEITLEKALTLVKDVFVSAAERDIFNGDSVAIKIITKDGIKDERCALRKD